MKDDRFAPSSQSANEVKQGCCCGGSARAAKETDHQSGVALQPAAKPDRPAVNGAGCCGSN